MTIQENEKKEENKTNQSNEPLIYTKEEKNFIKLSFRTVRREFEHELSTDNREDVRLGVKLYHDRFRMPGGRPHEIMKVIFRKMGYWEDGKTTLDERERKIINEKMANEKRLAEINMKRKKKLDEQLIAIQKEREQITNDPLMHKLDLTKEYDKLEANFKEQLEIEEREQTNKLQAFLREQAEAHEKMVKKVFADTEKAKKIVQDNAMRDAIIKSKAKLTESMINIENVAPKPTTTEVEIKKRNEEIDLELENLEGKTVAQLRKFAEDNEIDWAYNMRKSELIEHIQEKMEKK